MNETTVAPNLSDGVISFIHPEKAKSSEMVYQENQPLDFVVYNKITLESDQISKWQPYLENCGSHNKNCVASADLGFFRVWKGRQRSVLEPDINIDRLVEVLVVEKFDPEASSGQKWKLIAQEYYNTKKTLPAEMYPSL